MNLFYFPYLEKVSEKGIESNKGLWHFIKPFLLKNEALENGDITLIEKKPIITNDTCLGIKIKEYLLKK